MKRFVVAGSVLVASLAPASAQVSIDMSRITCTQYLAMAPEETAIVSSWLSGWFNHRIGSVSVDMNAFARNIANVKTWCLSNGNATVMSGLEASIQRAK